VDLTIIVPELAIYEYINDIVAIIFCVSFYFRGRGKRGGCILHRNVYENYFIEYLEIM